MANGGGYGKSRLGLGRCLAARETGALDWSLSDDGSLVSGWRGSMTRAGMIGGSFVVSMVYQEDWADDSSLS